jgi:nitrite reductase/ring-hydroxylating ferredoxin subunit
MAELRWVKVAKVGDLAPGTLKRAELDILHTITLANVEGEYYALDSRCPHANFPLYAGRLLGSRLVCAGHSWCFDARTGQGLVPRDAPSAKTYPVRVEGDDVLVGWEPPAPPPRRPRPRPPVS